MELPWPNTRLHPARLSLRWKPCGACALPAEHSDVPANTHAEETLMPDDIGSMPDILARICNDKRAEVAVEKTKRGIDALRQEISARAGPTRGFGFALKEAAAAGHYALITEIKKASPSSGLIRRDFDPAGLAKAYQAGGAACLSVLTERRALHGRSGPLKAARAAVSLPVLRKDFIVDPWQVYESRAMGADCILLIMAAVTDAQARELEQLARASTWMCWSRCTTTRNWIARCCCRHP